MSVLSRIYVKILFKKFKKLEKINFFYRNLGSKKSFSVFIRDRSVNKNFKFSKYSFSPHNPLTGPPNAIKWICENYHAVFDYLDVNPPKSLLEIGCGFGLSTWIMNDSTKKKAVGLDKNKEEIYNAKTLFPEVNFICDDFKSFFKKNPKAFFDVIVASNGPVRIRKKYSKFDKNGLEIDTTKKDKILNEKILSHCNTFIQVGYRAKTFKQFISWEHKASSKHLSFSTSLVNGKNRGISLKYFKYYLTYDYLNKLLHSFANRYYPPF